MKKRRNKKNIFYPWKNEWKLKDWKNYIGDFQYCLKRVDEIPSFIKECSLINKFNSVIVANSGSTTHEFYGITGYRPDENYTVIDEHPYIIVFDKNTEDYFCGFIDHGSYSGRTVKLSQEQIYALNASGVTANISFSRLPSKSTGSLEDLHNEGLLNGTSVYFNKILEEYKKNQDKNE